MELLYVQLEVMNILETRAYEITGEERIPVIKNWLGLKGLYLKETFTQKEKVKCKTTKVLFSSAISNRFKLHHSHIIPAVQYQKLCRKEK